MSVATSGLWRLDGWRANPQIRAGRRTCHGLSPTPRNLACYRSRYRNIGLSPGRIGYSEHVDADPAWRVPAVEAGIDLAECRFRRHARHSLLCDRVRPRASSCGGAAISCSAACSGSFAIFAAVCGIARLLSILTLWVPAYDIEGLTKGLLALISARDHGGTAAVAAADPGAAVTHATCASQCGACGGNPTPAQGRGHGQAFSGDRGQRGPGPAGAEDGSDRPTHRWCCARLQQHSDRDHRNHRNPRRRGQGSSAISSRSPI